MADLGSQKRHKRINLTDPEARLMKGRQGIVAGYNAQAMVSPMETAEGATSMVVIAVDVVDAANDNALLVPMVEQAEEKTGTRVPMTLADAGYFAASHLAVKGVAVQDKCPLKWPAEMSLGQVAMVSDDDVVGPAQGCCVGGPSAARYFLMVALWIPNSRSIARSGNPLRRAF